MFSGLCLKMQAATGMKISVIIPVFNGERTVENNLAAVKQQKSAGNDVEVIVVDDGSFDKTPEILRKISDITVVTQKNRGPAAARNSGARQASGEILVFTDSDTVPHANWLQELTSPFSDPAIKACAGTYTIANAGNTLAEIVQKEIELRHQGYGTFIKFAGTYNLAIRKTLFEKIGGFNEAYTQASGEDNDLCYRILRESHEIRFVSSAKVAHHHPEKLYKYLKEQYRHGYWRALLYRQFPERISGDSYTSIKDAMEVPLSLATILAVFSSKSGLRRILGIISALAAAALFLWEIHYAGRIAKEAPQRLFAAGVFTLRAFARTLGLMGGLLMKRPPASHGYRND